MAEAQAEGSGKKRDFGKILGFAFIGINLVGLGLGCFLVYSSTLGHHAAVLREEEAQKEMEKFEETLRDEPVLFSLKQFNTNLDGVPRRLIRMEVSLEMLDEEGFEEVVGLGPQARDAIVRVINAKTYADVESVQGKLQLKSQIAAELNGFLKSGVVKNVYFSDFVVQ
ncbi:MAG: flagellar protein FliL [Bdellovibrionaceae bacterium]|nr:flagellar protein FliL [Pseudobdellovibrionaceae bacterium]|tara:strand:+ start:252 stop:755 length:504 start_codon:yes stop_codon:yes gene_type:complete